MRPPGWLVAVLVGALGGLIFASVSTYDFVQHLDRQVHSLHCSFIPGASPSTGASGCQAAMMSSYSSVFRTSIWGGIPISLAAMAVFAFLMFYAIDLVLTRRKDDVRATAFLALGTLLPALTSVLMLTISLTKLDAVCKMCAGIYISSAVCLLGAVMSWRRAISIRNVVPLTREGSGTGLSSEIRVPQASNAFLAGMFGIGVAFVAVPVILYAVMAPDHGKFIGTCGQLDKPDDTYAVMVPVQRGGRTPALEILDPLCPACKAFEQRIQASGLAGDLDRRAILFPLDTTCNWMITENTHPGACAVSEAVLCAGDNAPAVLRWAFEVQDSVRDQTKVDPTAAERIVKQRFPELAACVGSPEARSRLIKSLRWSVSNNIRVLTPQLFVNNVKLCDEDVDIGLDYALSRLISGETHGVVQTAKPVEAGAVPAPPAPGTSAPAATKSPTAPTAETPSAGDKKPEGPVTTPGSDKPAATTADGKPADDKPADKPAADKPAADQAADKSAVDKPAAPAPSDKPATPAPSDKPATPAPAAPAGGPPAPSTTPTSTPAGGAS